MNRFWSALCKCMMFSGLLLCCPSLVVRGAPPPPTKCDLECREKKGPFQETVIDDPTATCWQYEEPSCLNCRNGQDTRPDQKRWSCTGAPDKDGPWCKGIVLIEVPVYTQKAFIDPDATGKRCTKLCDQFLFGYDGQERIRAGVVGNTELAELWQCGPIPAPPPPGP